MKDKKPVTRKKSYRFSDALIARIEAAAKAREWNPTQYIRNAVTRQLIVDEREDPRLRPPPA